MSKNDADRFAREFAFITIDKSFRGQDKEAGLQVSLGGGSIKLSSARVIYGKVVLPIGM